MKTDTDPTRKGRPREFDADDALDQAMHVFWRKGYLGTSLTDLTEAMGISRPSLYAAFGNKEELYKKVMQRYSSGPAACSRRALDEPTARAVVEKMLRGIVELVTGSCNPRGCLWVQGTLSSGDPDDPVRKELAAGRRAGETDLRKRFARAIKDGDLPRDSDPAALARYISTVIYGMAFQASNGASRNDLLRVVELVLHTWPPTASPTNKQDNVR